MKDTTKEKIEMTDNTIDEVKSIINWLDGFSTAYSVHEDTNLFMIRRAMQYLEKLNRHICGQGFIGCKGGRDCTSSHK